MFLSVQPWWFQSEFFDSVELKSSHPCMHAYFFTLTFTKAAPWTLFFYMVGCSSKKRQDEGEKWLLEHTEGAQNKSLSARNMYDLGSGFFVCCSEFIFCAFLKAAEDLLDRLTPVVIEYVF